MEKVVDIVRERPQGMIPFAAGAGVLVLAGLLLWSQGLQLGLGPLPGVLVGAVLVGVGIAAFRLPHRLQLTPAEVRIAGRFGRPRRWQHARLVDPPTAARLAAEVAVVLGVLGALALASGLLSPVQLPLALGYACGWCRWRLAPRAVLEDDDGARVVVQLEGLPGASEAIAARAARTPR